MREYLMKLREENGGSQEEIAKEIGVCQQFYSMIEQGKRQKDLDLSLALKLAKCFGVSIDFIIAEEEKLKREAV